jgi:saccharopine dehydrogenase-like protein
MTTTITPTGRVHWLGTGLSTGSGLALVCSGAETLLWGRTAAKAGACLERLGLAGRAEVRALETSVLAAELRPGDVVVSMLPATLHSELVKLSIDHGAHFACSSYVSPGIASHAEAAEKAGLVVQTEAGLDPGIDHLLSHELVRMAVAETGERSATVRFTSYCGANPAVANDFRYRFSWAPRGVLTALLTPATFLEDGAAKTVAHPWESVRTISLNGEPFEVYPNRDSLPFIERYQFPASWTLEEFVRGTLRLDGWSRAWAPVFEELPAAGDDRITALADDLAQRYPTTPQDHDRVVMSVALEVTAGDGTAWRGQYDLDVTGDETEAVTPRLVSVGLACAVLEMMAGRTAPGLHFATSDPEAIQRWLAFLKTHGIEPACRVG